MTVHPTHISRYHAVLAFSFREEGSESRSHIVRYLSAVCTLKEVKNCILEDPLLEKDCISSATCACGPFLETFTSFRNFAHDSKQHAKMAFADLWAFGNPGSFLPCHAWLCSFCRSRSSLDLLHLFRGPSRSSSQTKATSRWKEFHFPSEEALLYPYEMCLNNVVLCCHQT